MLNHTFTFNGHSSDEFGIKIERFRALNRPGRKYDAASVPGRNGILYKLQEAWEEILVSYEIFAEASIADTEADFSKIDGTYFAWTADGLTINGTVPSPYEIEEAAELLTTRNRTIIVSGGEVGVWGLECRVVDAYGTTTRTSTITNGSETFILTSGDWLYIDLKIYAGTYSNKVIPLKVVDAEILDLPKKWTNIMEWLNSADGYTELTDTYDPQHYYEAVFVDGPEIANSWNKHGRTVISFRCRPERFLRSGQHIQLDLSDTITIGFVNSTSLVLRESPSVPSTIVKTMDGGEQFKILNSQTVNTVLWYQVLTEDNLQGWCQGEYVTVEQAIVLNNPTKHIAKPYITLSPVGTDIKSIKINHTKLAMSSTPLYAELYIDCENENITGVDSNGIFRNWNNRASLIDNLGNTIPDFLKFKSGENIIVVDTVSAVEFDANFWEI